VSIVLMILMWHECEYFSCRSLSANEPLIVGIGGSFVERDLLMWHECEYFISVNSNNDSYVLIWGGYD